jgi:RNA polymerase sigma-70 factor (ECF subfamily)
MLFHLRYEEGYNASELSEMLGLPPGTIRARLSRCRMILKKQLSNI